MKRTDLFLLFGPPGAGKTTQAQLFEEKMGLTYLSWGALSRQIIDGTSPEFASIASEVREKTVSGAAFQPKFIQNILRKKLREILHETHNVKGLILDGFPRYLSEAHELTELIEEFALQPRYLIRFNIDLATIRERVATRSYCPTCGKSFSDDAPSQTSGRCLFDRSELIKRPDDFYDTTIDRYNTYVQDTTEIFSFLSKRFTSSFSVNANQNELFIFAEILNKMQTDLKDSQTLYRLASETSLQTSHGDFRFMAFQNVINYDVHLAFVCGNVADQRTVLTRVHSSCITGDIFHSRRCDCGEQLDQSLAEISKRGNGILIYLFQEGRGINIINKIKAYELQSQGLDTVEANEKLGLPAELRNYDAVHDILHALQIKSIDLLTNNPHKIQHLQSCGILVEKTTPLHVSPNVHNENYLLTKMTRMGHTLDLQTNPTYAIS